MTGLAGNILWIISSMYVSKRKSAGIAARSRVYIFIWRYSMPLVLQIFEKNELYLKNNHERKQQIALCILYGRS